MKLIAQLAGLILYENIFSLFAIVGVILHTSAFWITKESTIRKSVFSGFTFLACL